MILQETIVVTLITFTPTSSGLKTATVTILSNDSDESPYTISIQGTGIAPTPEIDITEFENLDPSTKVYIYDSLLETYTKINDKNTKYVANLEAGNHVNRFFITFKKENNTTISIADEHGRSPSKLP